ncbi:hypothetical protein ACXDTH_004994 [Klebsiella variicola]
MYTTDNPGKFKVQWHRFTDDSPLHQLLKTVPHVAFKVDDLSAAICDEEVILGPYEPFDVNHKRSPLSSDWAGLGVNR